MTTQVAEAANVEWTDSKLANDILSQIQNAASNVPPEQFVRAFSSCFDNEDIKVQFEAEIKHMADTIRRTKAGFEEVGVHVSEIDNIHYKRRDGSEPEPLQPTWEAYSEDFKAHLHHSSDSAKHLQLLCRDYIDTVLPAVHDPTMTDKDLKGIAEHWQDSMTFQEKPVEEYRVAFEDLKRNVTDFKIALKAAADDGKYVYTEHNRLAWQITELQALLYQQGRNAPVWVADGFAANEFGAETGNETGSAFGFGVALLLSAIAPFSMGAAVLDTLSGFGGASVSSFGGAGVSSFGGAGVSNFGGTGASSFGGASVSGFGVTTAPITDTYSINKAQLENLKKRFELNREQKRKFMAFESRLAECYEKIDFVATKMGTFAAFWSAVHLDAQFIHKKLNNAINANTRFGTFQVRQALGEKYAGDIYIALRQVLECYIVQD
ncbi:hypothetical protein BDN72DRAFT_902441 [Pluteus cervinus]|uniref:Uncharacterized protein n=1 Tax=Pluteus cervinus TaxID=181527 RepID=A0ACD3AEZ4_9AGAR|nr:hypothetical protein BDN72DRAFT_902441 [Pluteus cervinus]